jgi:hypothetical protein
MTIDSSQRVGIGTTSPAATLDIFGNQLFSAANPQIQFNAGGPIIRLPSANTLAFLTDSTTERARIDSSGRLLVGTSTARANFYNSSDTARTQVEYTGSFAAGASYIYNASGTGGADVILAKTRATSIGGTTIVASGDTLGTLSFQGIDGTEFVAGAEIRCQVDGTPGTDDMPGRLVFSTTADGAATPTERLRITSAGQIAVAGAGTAAAPVITKNDDLNTGIFFPAADTIAFAEGGSEAARIDDAGRLLVGTSTPINSLNKGEIRWSAQTGEGGTGGFAFYNTSTTAATADQNPPLLIYKGSATTSSSARFVQFFADNASTAMGGIVGNGASNVQFASLSDIRDKENIQPVANALNKIKELEVVSYDWKQSKEHVKAGFIAQNIETVFPEYVVENMASDGNEPRKGITGGLSSGYVAVLTAALQEAIAKIEALETRLTAAGIE